MMKMDFPKPTSGGFFLGVQFVTERWICDHCEKYHKARFLYFGCGFVSIRLAWEVE